MKTCATLFSGGGLADIGLRRAGLTPLWAVEYDPAIAAVYAANHGDHIIVSDVRFVDYTTLPAPWLLWASPPCPSFSVAKTDRGETETDREIAAAVVRAIETLRPQAVVVENVEGYADSKSLRSIRAVLDRLDYWSHAQVVNSADMGTPQTRRRLILRARAGGWMQAFRPWPAPVRWRGWYEAIEDLIPTLPNSAFAPWQLARLPKELRESVLAVVQGGNSDILTADQPAQTIGATHGASKYRALIIDGQGSGAASGLTVRHSEAPMYTVTAGSGTKRGARVWLSNNNAGTDNYTTLNRRCDDEPASTVVSTAKSTASYRALIPPGRVVSMTPRALARFQGVPDTYALPERKSLACRVIGNGVAVEVAYEAARSLL